MGNNRPSWRFELVWWPAADQPRLELWRVTNGGARYLDRAVATKKYTETLPMDSVLQELYTGLLHMMHPVPE